MKKNIGLLLIILMGCEKSSFATDRCAITGTETKCIFDNDLSNYNSISFKNLEIEVQGKKFTLAFHDDSGFPQGGVPLVTISNEHDASVLKKFVYLKPVLLK